MSDALDQSITKWRKNSRVRAVKNSSIGIENCPLCAVYYEAHHCEGCPVYLHTGEKNCSGAPIAVLPEAIMLAIHGDGCRAFRKVSKAMAEMLEEIKAKG